MLFKKQNWDADTLQDVLAQAIKKLAKRGLRGQRRMPLMAHITISAPPDVHPLIQTVLEQREFESDLSARLANELSLTITAISQRRYTYAEGPKLTVSAVAGSLDDIQLEAHVTEDDAATVEFPLPSALRILGGRGPFHGGDRAYPNHIILSETNLNVSRKAVVLVRHPGGIHARVPGPVDRALTMLHAVGRAPLSFERMADGCILTPGDELSFAEGQIKLKLVEAP